jgi:CP family cyanate transporter-like MFS transporter
MTRGVGQHLPHRAPCQSRRYGVGIAIATRHVVRPGLVIAGCMLIAANLRPPITSVGPLVGDIRADTGMSSAAAGLVTTLPLLAFAGVSPWAARIARRIGIERALQAALVVLVGGVLVRSAGAVPALLFGTAVLGSGIAVANVLIPALIKQDFSERVGPMTSGYLTTMVGMAGVAGGISVPLADAGLGWRGALAIWALLGVLAFVVWWPIARRAHHVPPEEARAPVRLRRSALAWQVTLFMGLQSLLFYCLIAWLPTLLEDDGLSRTTAGGMYALLQISSLAATISVPVLAARRASQRRLVLVGSVSCLVGFAGLLADGGTLALLWTCFLGIGTGACFALALSFFALRSPDARHAGALSGMAQSIGYALAAGGPILIGFLHDQTDAWDASLVVLLGVSVAALGFGLLAARDRQVA